MKSAALFASLAALAACSPDGNLTPQATNVINTTIVVGQLFCSPGGQAAASGIVRIVNAADNKAVTVTGKAADVVAASCPVVNGLKLLPVPPPANPASVPVVAVANPPAATAPAAP